MEEAEKNMIQANQGELSEPVKSAKDDAGSEPEKNEKEDAAKSPKENAAKDAGGYHAPETPEELQAAIEAILFAMGDSVETAALAKALDKSAGEIRTALDALEARYETVGSGIMLQRFEDAVQLSTRPEQYQNLVRIAKVPKKVTLSDAVIETLSIIAYRQPITKAEIEQIRGVSCDYAINRLLSYDLIKELGRQDAPGRPILFGTTEQFLRTFGVQKIADLPQPSAATKEEFQQEAEAEVDERLNV